MKPKVDITEANGNRWTMGKLVSDALGEGTTEQNVFLSDFNAVATKEKNDDEVLDVLMDHAVLIFNDKVVGGEDGAIPSEESATGDYTPQGTKIVAVAGNPKEHEERGLMYLDTIQALVIENAEEYEQAVGVLADVKAVLAEMDAERKQITEGARKTIELLNDKYRPALTLYAEAESILKDKLVGFRADIDSIRNRLLTAGEDPVEPVPEVEGLTVREAWDIRVDKHDLPIEYLMPDMKAIKAAFKEDPERSIPGVIADKVETLVIEHKKVKR